MSPESFEIFLATLPGLEPALRDEVEELGYNGTIVPGGVSIQGHWPDVWRCNLHLRGASRVIARVGGFRAMHLAQLDKRARKFAWGDVLRKDQPFRVETTCRKSKIYHAGAATQRVERAINESHGFPIHRKNGIRVMTRIDDDFCAFSIDTSGEPLHRRGHKQAVGKAPMRETLAALFLRQCGYTGKEPVLDPMCGSGTFVIEAAEIALGLAPGRARDFAFEKLASFDPDVWNDMKASLAQQETPIRFYGSDRDQGAIASARSNADRAGVSAVTDFQVKPVSDIVPPEGPKGLVIVNPPYGARIGNKKLLYALYGALGQSLKERFAGWRVGLVTTETGLARATGLPFEAGPPIPHGGLKIRLFQTGALP